MERCMQARHDHDLSGGNRKSVWNLIEKQNSLQFKCKTTNNKEMNVCEHLTLKKVIKKINKNTIQYKKHLFFIKKYN